MGLFDYLELCMEGANIEMGMLDDSMTKHGLKWQLGESEERDRLSTWDVVDLVREIQEEEQPASNGKEADDLFVRVSPNRQVGRNV